MHTAPMRPSVGPCLCDQPTQPSKIRSFQAEVLNNSNSVQIMNGRPGWRVGTIYHSWSRQGGVQTWGYRGEY